MSYLGMAQLFRVQTALAEELGSVPASRLLLCVTPVPEDSTLCQVSGVLQGLTSVHWSAS
ncbi:rCG55130 [Rattus norvegicus]|uniref:RCG55130 n=1 Tax=Rattus norvegicus TaxID=10116 RepID=A6IIR6_RAT|nr:rCG55130 [Rattus norvegicus]